jgi:hypothetical protein
MPHVSAVLSRAQKSRRPQSMSALRLLSRRAVPRCVLFVCTTLEGATDSAQAYFGSLPKVTLPQADNVKA